MSRQDIELLRKLFEAIDGQADERTFKLHLLRAYESCCSCCESDASAASLVFDLTAHLTHIERSDLERWKKEFFEAWRNLYVAPAS